MMGMLASEEKRGEGVFIRTRQLGNYKQSKNVFCFLCLSALYKPVAAKYPSVNHIKMPEPEWRSAPQRISEKKSAENTHASAIVVKKSGLLKKVLLLFLSFISESRPKKASSKRF